MLEGEGEGEGKDVNCQLPKGMSFFLTHESLVQLSRSGLATLMEYENNGAHPLQTYWDNHSNMLAKCIVFV